jgi:hypothetical protein
VAASRLGLQDCSASRQPCQISLPRRKSNKPATLYRVMQAMIGHEHKARYEVPECRISFVFC